MVPAGVIAALALLSLRVGVGAAHDRSFTKKSKDIFETFASLTGGYPDCVTMQSYPGCADFQDGYGFAPCVECTQRKRTRPTQLRVACLGDSITAGTGATSQQHTYPSQLQQLLGDDYVVTNLGSGGSTMHRNFARPYNLTAMYRGFLKERWDIVVIMLGTNDARPINYSTFVLPAWVWWPWPALQHEWDYDNSEQWYAEDAESLIREAMSRGPHHGTPPEIFLMTPPPVTIDGTSAINKTIVNRVEPEILAQLSEKLLGGRPLIDPRPAFGGSDMICPLPEADWATRTHDPDAPPNRTNPCSLWTGCKQNFTEWEGVGISFGMGPLMEKAGGLVCDYLHPGNTGYKVLAEQVADAITRLKS